MKEFIQEICRFFTIQDIPAPLESHYLHIAVIVILCFLLLALFIAAAVLLSWLIHTAYCIIAYDYEVKTFPAKVIDKNYAPNRNHIAYNVATHTPRIMTKSPGYCVRVITEYGLTDTISDKDFYRLARKGMPLMVTLRIGRDHHQQIKYWKITKYSINAFNAPT